MFLFSKDFLMLTIDFVGSFVESEMSMSFLSGFFISSFRIIDSLSDISLRTRSPKMILSESSNFLAK